MGGVYTQCAICGLVIEADDKTKSTELLRAHLLTVHPPERPMGDIAKYGISGRRCRVCGETTGIPESDTCFDHRNAPMGASPGPWRPTAF